MFRYFESWAACLHHAALQKQVFRFFFFHKILLMVKEQLMNLFVLQQCRQNHDLAVVTQVMFWSSIDEKVSCLSLIKKEEQRVVNLYYFDLKHVRSWYNLEFIYYKNVSKKDTGSNPKKDLIRFVRTRYIK